VTKFAPHKALESTARGKLTFDDRVVLHRVDHLHQVRDTNFLYALHQLLYKNFVRRDFRPISDRLSVTSFVGTPRVPRGHTGLKATRRTQMIGNTLRYPLCRLSLATPQIDPGILVCPTPLVQIKTLPDMGPCGVPTVLPTVGAAD